MSPRIINSVAVFALAAACTRVPVRNIYCDGTARWTCGDPSFPVCDVAAQKCVAAGNDMSVTDGDMRGDDLAAPDLATCHTASDCPAAAPICDAGRCRACTGSGDDTACAMRSSTTPRCLASTGMCAACSTPNMQTNDCDASAPVCDATGTCRACASHDECTSRICNLDGTCYGGAVAYADNANGACTGTHAATLADPACEITTALTVQPTVRVFGSTTAYAKLSISTGTFRIVGPGLPAAGITTAVVSGDASSPAVVVSGVTTNVNLDGLAITGSGGSQDGVDCGQVAQTGTVLTILRTSIYGVGGAGVDATKCVVTLDRDVIGPSNAGGGIALSSSTYAITNTIVGANGASGPGVAINSGDAPIAGGPGFTHNTVAKNAGGGISCTPAATPIVNSIVWGNTGSSDLSANCTPTNSPISPAPDFVNATGPAYDFHLAGRTATNLANYIDQIASSPIDHDVDGRKRPQNVKWDIGAHEVP